MRNVYLGVDGGKGSGLSDAASGDNSEPGVAGYPHPDTVTVNISHDSIRNNWE
jgi:hypothetical protein